MSAMPHDVKEQAPPRRAGRLPRHVRMLLRLSRRQLPAPVYPVVVDRGLEVPAGDGAILLADHYRPVLGEPCPTLLVRCPYGRGFPWDYVYGALFAGQGFHVLLQSCRGTGGSGGVVDPFAHEAADAQSTVAWLREQDWFDGSLGTVGASYLGYTQWALAADPPPELRAMVVQVSSDDFYEFLYPGGAFALEPTLVGTAAMVSMQRGFFRFALAMLRLLRHRRRVERALPLIDSYPAAVGTRVGYFEEWLAHPEPDDPFWGPRRATVAAAVAPPAHLMTGWADVCLDPTLRLYRRLRDAERPARLLVGPWNHASGFNDDMPIVFGEALGWLRRYLCGEGMAPEQPVRVWVGAIGAPGQWRDLPDWPPPDVHAQAWHLHGDGTLATSDAAGEMVSSFRYDPGDPTPSVDGPSMDSRAAKPQRNNALEARADVLAFTSEPLREPVEVTGPVSIRVRVRGTGPHFDVFARLCDVDPRGRSWNVCDGLVRLRDGNAWAEVTVPMSATAHRFGAGHRLRVQISGGAHPRFMRNTGTGEPPATATRLVPVGISVGHGTLALPVLPGQPATARQLPGSGVCGARTTSIIMDSPRNTGVWRTCCSIDDADMV
jgi:putative CocE/NonD family hydrolase